MTDPFTYEEARMPQTTELFGMEAALYRFFQHRFPDELQGLRELGVLGVTAVEADRGPWDNISSHCMIVAIICWELGHLVDLSPDKIRKLVKVALMHDADKRSNREAIWAADGDEARNRLTREFEASKTGIEGVTSIDLRDFLHWDLAWLILRLADSYAGQTDDKKQAVTSWRTRIGQLIERDRTGEHGHHGHSQDVGDRLYGGRPFYEVLLLVSEHCEIVIFNAIIRHRSDYAVGGWTVDRMQFLITNAILKTLESYM